MKKISICMLILVLFTFNLKAQDNDLFLPTTIFGFKAGAHLGYLNTILDETSSTLNQNGFYIGSFLDFNKSEKWSIQTEVTYSSSKFEIDDKLNMLHIPILIKYNVTKNMEIYAGPESQFLLSISKTDIKSDVYKKFILGLDAGVNYKIAPQIVLDVRYNYAISKFIDFGYHDYKKINALQIGISYSFDYSDF